MTEKWTFHEAWNWLDNHPAFFFQDKLGAGWPAFKNALEIDVVKVDPITRIVEDDKSRNTHTEIWLECGPWLKEPDSETGEIERQLSHDIELDCGGDTFEEAILKLAHLVIKKYGDYDPSAPEYQIGSEQWGKKYGKW